MSSTAGPIADPAGIVASDNAVETTRWLGLNDRTVFRIAVAVAVMPIAIAAIRNGLMGWYPTWDSAYTASRVHDVFTRHPPLIGLYAAPSGESGPPYNYLGAIGMYLLAPTTKLFGFRWGLPIGMAILNTGWFVTAMWLARRRIGYRAGLVAVLFGASLVWALGSQILIDPTPANAGSIAVLCLLIAAWGTADGDPYALFVLAVSANYLVLSHPQFALVAPAVAGTGVIVWIIRLARLRKTSPPHWPRHRRRHLRWFAASIAVTVAMWLPPVIQQLTSPDGNLGRLFHAATSSSNDSGTAHRTLLGAFGVVSSPFTTWPLWFRDSLLAPNFDAHGPTAAFVTQALGVAVVLGLMILFALRARARHDVTVLLAYLIGLVGWGGWLASAVANPSGLGYKLNYFRALWPFAVFIWFTLAVGLIRSGLLRKPSWFPKARSVTTSCAAVGVLVFALASVPITEYGAGGPLETIRPARQLRAAIEHDVPRDEGPILLQADFNSRSLALYASAAVAFEEFGIPFRVRGDHDIGNFRTFRAYDPTKRNATRIMTVSSRPPDGHRHLLVELRPPTRLDNATTDRVGKALERWAASLTELRVGKAVYPDPAAQKLINTALEAVFAEDRAGGTKLLDQPAFVQFMVKIDPSARRSIVDLPGIDDRLVHTWFVDRQDRLENSTWVYLDPL